MPRLIRFVVGLLLASAVIAPAQTAVTLPADLDRRVQEICKDWDRKDAPGGLMAVALDGRLVLVKTFGLANLEDSVPITENTVFDIGSTSKQFTAMCILLLEEDGKLAVEDSASKYLPDIPILAAHKEITIRSLLTHTSGLRDYFVLMRLAGKRQFTHAEVLQLLRVQKDLNFPVNGKFMYSNTGYFLLGEIVSRVSGMPFPAFAQMRIFKPLGMESTRIRDAANIVIPRLADTYTPAGTTFLRAHTLLSVEGAGGVTTTVGDLMKWVNNYSKNTLGKGDPGLVARMQTAQLLADGRSANYGLGLFVEEFRGLRNIHHAGGWEAYRSLLNMFPEQKLAVISFSNDGTTRALTLNREVAKAILEPMLAPLPKDPPEVALEESVLKEYDGIYQLGDDRIAVVTHEKPRLRIQVTGQARLDVFAEKPDRFAYKAIPATVVFDRDSAGRLVSATIRQSGKTVRMPRIEPFVAGPKYSEELVGNYWSPELDSPATVSLANGALFVNFTGFGTLGLAMHLRDHGMAGSLKVDFERDASGKVTVLRLSMERATDVRFGRKAPPPLVADGLQPIAH